MVRYLRQDPITNLMNPIEGVQSQPALRGQPVEVGADGVINPDLLPLTYDPKIDAVAGEALQAGDLCYLYNDGAVRKVRKAVASDRTTLATVFVKHSCALGADVASYIHGVLVVPNPGTFTAADTGSSLFLSPTIPGYLQKLAPTTLGPWIQRVAVVTDVTDTEVRCFFIGYLDRGKPSGSGVVDTDPLVVAHLTDETNPHQVTAAQVGALEAALLGVASGVAPLGADSLVPPEHLPLSPWKPESVRCAATTNIPLAAPGASIDGRSMVVGDRVLLTAQDDPAQNGVYVWEGDAVALTRAEDANTSAEIWGAIWRVREGASQLTAWVNTNATAPTLGTSNITFVKFISTSSWVNPLTSQGDLLVGQTGGNPGRLPVGAPGTVLTMVGGIPQWQTINATGLQNPMTTVGDLIVGGTAGAATRLGIGINGQVLTLVAGHPVWTAPVTGMANPMTADWDLLIGGTAGVPARLAKGTNGQVLTMSAGAIVWGNPNLVNPMTTPGDLITGGVAGAPTRLSPGANGQVLTLVAGTPAWVAPNTGMSNPMFNSSDLIVGGSGGAPARLAKGANGQVLTMVAGVIAWASGLTNPMTAAEDLLKGGVGGAAVRLAKGNDNQVLTMVGGVIAWAAPQSGFTTPMTTRGDIIIGLDLGAPERLGVGTDGQVLTLVAGLPAWVNGASNPTTTQGDLIVRGAADLERLGKGTNGQVLTMVAGAVAWADNVGGSGMSNPMTTAGDLIVGGVDGTPGRIATGTNGQVLKVVAGVPAWAAEAESMTDPTTTLGDLIVRGAAAPERLGKGTNGHVLKMVAGVPAWAAEDGGLTNPMTTAWDLLVGGIDGAPSRLAKGGDNQVLTMVAGSMAWADAQGGGGGMTNPMTAVGDLIVGGTAGAPTRLAKATDGQVLKLVAGSPTWAAEGSGMTNPMTALGDFIVGGASGVPQRMVKGNDGQLIKMVAGAPAWVNPDGAALVNPMTAAGDFIVGGDLGTPARLPIGLEGQILGVSGGELAYVSPTGVSPASAMQTVDRDDWAPAPLDPYGNEGQGTWFGGLSSLTDTLVPQRAGNVFKLVAKCLLNGYPDTGPAIFAADGVTTGEFTINLKVNGIVVATTTATITDATLPADFNVDNPLIYAAAAPLVHELRVPDLNTLSVELVIEGVEDDAVVFWAPYSSGYPSAGYGSTTLHVEEWDFTYKISGIKITPSDTWIIIPKVVPDAGSYPNYTYVNSPCGETSPSWHGNADASLMTGDWSNLGHPESWHQATVPAFVGASYKWTVEGAYVSPNGTQGVTGDWSDRVYFVATLYSDIALTCEITLPGGEVVVAKHSIQVHHQDAYCQGNGMDSGLYGGAAKIPIESGGQITGTIGLGTDGLLQVCRNHDMWEALGQTQLPVIVEGASDPELIPLPNGYFVATYFTESNIRGYCFFDPMGEPLYDGPSDFPYGAEPPSDNAWVWSFEDTGSIVAADVTPSNLGNDQVIIRHMKNGDPETEYWTMPTGVTVVALAVDPNVYGDFLAFTSDYQLIHVTLPGDYSTPIVTYFWDCVSGQDGGWRPVVEEPLPGGAATLNIPDAKMALRTINMESYVYLWGSDGVVVRARYDSMLPEIKVIINRKSLLNVVVSYDSAWVLGEDEDGNNFGYSDASWLSGTYLLNTGNFEPMTMVGGITEASPLVLRPDSLNVAHPLIPHRVFRTKETGKPGDWLEYRIAVPDTNAGKPRGFEFFPKPTVNPSASDTFISEPFHMRVYTYKARFEGNSLECRIYVPTTVPNMGVEVTHSVLETLSRQDPITAASTITPTAQIAHVTGNTPIDTITPPGPGFNGQFTLIADGMITLTDSGNIAVATAPPDGVALTLTYDSDTSKWYPSVIFGG